MKLNDLYENMWSLGNQNHLPCGELPEHYQGTPYSYENFKDNTRWYDDSNFFGNPFQDETPPRYFYEDEWDEGYEGYSSSDSYKILGIKRSSSQEEIKLAFRQKALETHPDKGGDPEEFKKVRAAYESIINWS